MLRKAGAAGGGSLLGGRRGDGRWPSESEAKDLGSLSIMGEKSLTLSDTAPNGAMC